VLGSFEVAGVVVRELLGLRSSHHLRHGRITLASLQAQRPRMYFCKIAQLAQDLADFLERICKKNIATNLDFDGGSDVWTLAVAGFGRWLLTPGMALGCRMPSCVVGVYQFFQTSSALPRIVPLVIPHCELTCVRHR